MSYFFCTLIGCLYAGYSAGFSRRLRRTGFTSDVFVEDWYLKRGRVMTVLGTLFSVSAFLAVTVELVVFEPLPGLWRVGTIVVMTTLFRALEHHFQQMEDAMTNALLAKARHLALNGETGQAEKLVEDLQKALDYRRDDLKLMPIGLLTSIFTRKA